MNTLILGGAGFIGSHIADYLLVRGHNVEVVDNFKYCHNDNLTPHPNLNVVKDDLFDYPILNQWDEIYLCAAVCSTPDFIAEPVLALGTEITQVQMACEYALETSHKVRILYCSSSEVYGVPVRIPTPETEFGNVNTLDDRSGYSEGKRAGEALLYAYRRQHGVRASIVRIFNTYGPRQTDSGNMIACMVKDALETKVVTVYGSGDTTRTLLYVDDAVDAIAKAMERQHEFPINIGGDYEFDILRYAWQIAGSLGAEVVHDHSIYDPIPRRRPDITAAKKVLGWKPTTPQDIGVSKTIGYWRNRL